jgi:hypothetical protein
LGKENFTATDLLLRTQTEPGISVVNAALAAANVGEVVHAMHDPTEGGLAMGTEGNGKEGIKESKGTSAPSQAPAKGVDPRFQPFVDLIHDRYKAVNKADCPWGPADGKQAKVLLASLDAKDWTIEKLDRCVQFKLLSFDRPASEAPHRGIQTLSR